VPAPAADKLEACLRTLDESSLRRVAHAVERARAADQGDPADAQILNSLRPRLRKIRPDRVKTFQRAICTCLEPFLAGGEIGGEKRRGVIPRRVLAPWWKVLMNSPERAGLQALEQDYAACIRKEKWDDADEVIDRACHRAGEMTLTLLAGAERSVARCGELALMLGGMTALDEVREIGALLRLNDQLTPALQRIRQAAPARADGKILDFTPPAVAAAKAAYLSLPEPTPELIEYFFIGLMASLAQPWEALRLVRLLSAEMSKGAPAHLAVVPTRLFMDLTRILTDVGRAMAGEGGVSRKIWLLTCARLLSDAGQMIQGLASEGPVESVPDWDRRLMEARQRIAQSIESFATLAIRECCAVLPVKEFKERGCEVRLLPDMARAPGEDEVAVAQAAAVLFSAARKLADQEGIGPYFRAKENEIEHRLSIGVRFRIDFLRARGKHPVALSQLDGVGKVLRGLPSFGAIRELEYRVERMSQRFR